MPPTFVSKILVPRPRSDVLVRQRLIDFLNSHLDRRLLLVCAPAGYGKTALLVNFAHQVDLPVCWYSLGPADADPQVFLEYLATSIRRRFPRFGERTFRYLKSAGAKDIEATIGLLVSELHETLDDRFLIVLDDVHTIDSQPSIQKVLDLLIAGLPDGCCCILSSRMIPRIRLSRLVANREAAGLGTADLAFTAAEIKQLFNRHYSLVLPEASAEEIARDTEGWIAGIILTSHTLWQGLVGGLIQAKKSGGPVFDYLADEVFSYQPAGLQEFLLGSSILDRMNAKHCDILLERTDSAELLGILDVNHLFLFPLEGDGDWYRYHPLFQEFLRTRLRTTDPERFARLHLRAGELAEAEMDVDAAIEHYLLADAEDRAVTTVERFAAATIDAGRIQTVLRWVSILPAELVGNRPHLQIERARAAFEAGELQLAQTALDNALEVSLRLNDQRLIASVRIWNSRLLRTSGKFQEAIAACREGLAIAEEHGDTPLIALGYENLGISLGAAGYFADAIPELERALVAYNAINDRYNEAIVSHATGVALKRLGEFARAQQFLTRASDCWRALGNSGWLAGTLVVLGNLQYEQGRFDEALTILTDAENSAQESGYLRLAGYATSSVADVLRDRGDHRAALTAYEQSLTVAERVGDPTLQIQILDGLGRCRLLTGDISLAYSAVSRARQLASERESLYEQGMCADAYGAVLLEDGQIDQAISVLKQACARLESTGAVRELTRAQLHLARALLQAGKRQRAVRLALDALNKLPGANNDPIFVAEGRALADVLRAALPSGPPWLAEVVRQLPSDQPLPAGRASSISLIPVDDARPIQCFSLGRADLVVDGRVLAPEDGWSQKMRDIWFYLLAEGPVSIDRIVNAVWPDSEFGRGQASFHSTLYRMRRTLFPGCIEHRSEHWSIGRSLAIWTDDAEFEQLASMAIRGKLESDTGGWDAAIQAISLYKGPYLEMLESSWPERRRQHLAHLYLLTLQEVIQRLVVDKAFSEAIAYAQLFLQTDPDNESIHAIVMQSYAASGNRPAALRHFQQYAQQLKDELDTEPSAQLWALYQQLANKS